VSSDGTSLGDRMKRYEHAYHRVLPRRTYTIMRVDGRAFHTLLRGAKKPFDLGFMSAMDHVAETLCSEVQGAKLGYVQSDEVSILYTDFDDVTSEPWFGGVEAKQISVGAAIATEAFNDASSDWTNAWAHFDARVFTMSDPVEVANYFLWRQRDATRNSITMTAQAHFSHRELHGVNTKQMQEKLWSEKQVNWNDMPDEFKRGRVVRRHRDVEDAIPVSHWLTEPAPVFSAEPGGFLAQAIPPLPSLHQ
jgi:tRNA(His) guanylyltransferase